MKLIADPIYIPDNADWQTIEDAKARANWHEVKSREELMKDAWPSGVIVSARTIDVNITRIRKKIEPYSRFLCTRHGYGYYFTNENEKIN